MKSEKISATRFSYRLGGTAASIIADGLIGAEFGGPYGAVAGVAIGGVFWAGAQSYDGVVWFGNQVSRGTVQIENAFKNGWYPGR